MEAIRQSAALVKNMPAWLLRQVPAFASADDHIAGALAGPTVELSLSLWTRPAGAPASAPSDRNHGEYFTSTLRILFLQAFVAQCAASVSLPRTDLLMRFLATP